MRDKKQWHLGPIQTHHRILSRAASISSEKFVLLFKIWAFPLRQTFEFFFRHAKRDFELAVVQKHLQYSRTRMTRMWMQVRNCHLVVIQRSATSQNPPCALFKQSSIFAYDVRVISQFSIRSNRNYSRNSVATLLLFVRRFDKKALRIAWRAHLSHEMRQPATRSRTKFVNRHEVAIAEARVASLTGASVIWSF